MIFYVCVCTDLNIMDSEMMRDGRVMDIVDQKWREDRLPSEDIAVPQMHLPELESDNGHSTETLTEQEQKWTDVALTNLHDAHHSSATN